MSRLDSPADVPSLGEGRHLLPALRGRFGDWAYYSALMTLEVVNERVRMAHELHSVNRSRELSRLIQRELQGGREKEIANYLRSNSDRFFNSLVIAVYGGEPEWLPFEIKARIGGIDIENLDSTSRHSVGFFALGRSEELYALDGQHRLAGIRAAIKTNPELARDEVSVLIVAHHNDEAGMRRTRKLFTTLNKTAKPVHKSEIIALDEADISAIVTRHLVENHRFFADSRTEVLRRTPNLPSTDAEHITTIVNLYDTVDTLFSSVVDKVSPKDWANVKSLRPDDIEVQRYIKIASSYFEKLASIFPELEEYFLSKNPGAVLRKYRGRSGGHILFRPVGQTVFVQFLGHLRRSGMSMDESFSVLSRLPTNLAKPPYAGVLWDKQNGTVINKGSSLTRDLLLHMVGKFGGSLTTLRKRYASALGVEPTDVSLPGQVSASRR
nr:DNA sulfur modification protein DndB [Siccirubricoccus soli]